MFSKLAIVATTVFAALAVAAPAPAAWNGPSGQSSTGSQQCCNSVQKADSPQASKLLGALGLQVAADLLVGITCSPISIAAIAGGSSCSQQPVSCNNDNFNGIVALGCTPLNVAA